MLMKTLQKQSMLQNRTVLALHKPQMAFIFTGIPKDNTHLIPQEMMELETTAFKERVSQKNRDIMAAERLSSLRMQEDYIDDPNHWWNKLQTLTEDEMKLMPMGFIRKYGSYISNLQRYDREFHMDENKHVNGYFSQIQNLKKLQTDEEKALMLEEFKASYIPDVITMANLERERGDYMSRQPRVKPSELSYNFEQYSRYSRILAKAIPKDKQASENFYTKVKYVKKNIDNKTDSIVRDFTETQGFVSELIEIPEEFEDLPIAGLTAKDFARRKSNRKLIKTHKSKNMINYDAWRCHDRKVIMADARHPNVAKYMLAPADVWKVFGMPDEPTIGIFGTGEYNFEDNNLDCYKLYDYKQTDLYHGLNREDEYYTTPKNMRKPIHKRKKKYPSVEEFWKSTEPVEFKLTADEDADVRRFKRWFRSQMKTLVESELSFEERIMQKYRDKIDICMGDFAEKGVINEDMAVHKLVCTDYMSKDEIKDYPHGNSTLCVAPKMFDLEKSTRIYTTKEELDKLEQERELLKHAD